ncbi:MAG TPA: DASS family sodium-coupled anion symporter [Polyangiaceae bacterium]|nr:DASS family sodium-coupled anion symporter [Polyangiaceae bacterium]
MQQVSGEPRDEGGRSAAPGDPPEDKGAKIRRIAGISFGVAAFLAIAFTPNALHQIPGQGHRPAYAAGVTALMAIWWLTEAVPIAVTACAPLVLYPALGVFGKGFVGDVARSTEPFWDAYIFLFMGGMIIGAAMEQWNLHRRVALHIMRAIGTRPKRLLFGMLVATAGISLWISNTATAVMMLPIAAALLAQLEAAAGRKLWHFGGALMLSVAYAANVGGVGTKIGTGTNSIFCGFVAEKLKIDIGFLHFMALGLPFVILFIPVTWAVLWRTARKDDIGVDRGRELLDQELRAMGPMSSGERKVAAVFLAAALLWIAGDAIRRPLGPLVPELWTGFKFQGKHYEAGVAMLAALSLFAMSAVSQRALRRVPWSTLLLLGGSFAMAAGIEGSGLSKWIALQFEGVAGMPLAAQIGLATGGTVVLSAVASNTATVNVALNVLPPAMPVLAATMIASSCDFMLPAGTPPNAIVFGSGAVRLPVMMKTGFVLDVLAIVLITAYMLVYGRFLF